MSKNLFCIAVVALTAFGMSGAHAQAPNAAQTAANVKKFESTLALAVDNNPGAQYNLGVYYEKGLGVPADLAMARSWYQKAADQGHFKAQFNLGVMHMQGDGGPKDPVAAGKLSLIHI